MPCLNCRQSLTEPALAQAMLLAQHMRVLLSNVIFSVTLGCIGTVWFLLAALTWPQRPVSPSVDLPAMTGRHSIEQP